MFESSKLSSSNQEILIQWHVLARQKLLTFGHVASILFIVFLLNSFLQTACLVWVFYNKILNQVWAFYRNSDWRVWVFLLISIFVGIFRCELGCELRCECEYFIITRFSTKSKCEIISRNICQVRIRVKFSFFHTVFCWQSWPLRAHCHHLKCQRFRVWWNWFINFEKCKRKNSLSVENDDQLQNDDF